MIFAELYSCWGESQYTNRFLKYIAYQTVVTISEENKAGQRDVERGEVGQQF